MYQLREDNRKIINGWGHSTHLGLSDIRSRQQNTLGANDECSTAARLSLTRVQLLECALQLFKLLSRLPELAFRSQTLVIGEVFGRFRDESVEVACRPRRSGQSSCVSSQLRRDEGGATRRNRPAKKCHHRLPNVL